MLCRSTLSASNGVTSLQHFPDTPIGESVVSNSTPVRNAPLVVTALLALLGVLLIIIAIIYFTKTAEHLPSFFPGHETNSRPERMGVF